MPTSPCLFEACSSAARTVVHRVSSRHRPIQPRHTVAHNSLPTILFRSALGIMISAATLLLMWMMMKGRPWLQSAPSEDAMEGDSKPRRGELQQTAYQRLQQPKPVSSGAQPDADRAPGHDSPRLRFYKAAVPVLAVPINAHALPVISSCYPVSMA